MYYEKKRGFTLIELLLVIAIIALFSSAIFVRLNSTRGNAQIAKAQVSLNSFGTAIILLGDDTGETVAHFSSNTATCPTSAVPNEIYLDTAEAGLEQTDGLFTGWDGPYIRDVGLDPWGSRYVFDDDYTCAAGVLGCDNFVGDTRAIYSAGPNASDLNVYDSDNIVKVLCRR